MSWYFSKAAASALLQAGCSVTESCAESNQTSIADLCSWLAKTMEASPPSQSGMTLEHSKGMRGVAKLTSLVRDSHVSPFRMQGLEKAKTTTATFGPIQGELLAKFDLDTSFWKTFHPLLSISEEYSPQTWPNSAMIVGTELYRLQMSADLIKESVGGLWLEPDTVDSPNGKRWPTPTASDWKGGTKAKRKDTGKPRLCRLDHCLEPYEGGKLSPDYVEWLMGVPIGWTSLEPLKETKLIPWSEDPGRGKVKRTGANHPHRKERLKALGNGQVPLQAFSAWKLFSKDFRNEEA